MAHIRKLSTKKKTQQKNPFATSSDGESIIGAFVRIVENIRHNSLGEETMVSLSEEFDLLGRRLELTPVQAVVMAIIIEADMQMGYAEMGNLLGISTLRMMVYADEIEELKRRHFIYSVPSMFDTERYGVAKEVVAAFLRNETFVPLTRKKMALGEFLQTIDSKIASVVDDETDAKMLTNDICEMMGVNSDLSVCRRVAKFDEEEQILFICCCCTYVVRGRLQVEWALFNSILGSSVVRSLEMTFGNGTNELLKGNLLTYGGASDFVDRTRIALTEEVTDALDMELNLNWRECRTHNPSLISCDTVVAKEMFYNDEEERSLIRLAELLRPQQFHDIQQRLGEKGMHKGFACLFYGGPGTGKTETAMQVAKASGRDIMRIDIASVRSKWVGESEKNIRNIFRSYYRLQRTDSPIPVLLFNEADALFCRRNGNAERSVDKMENALQNILLEEMERFEGILIATTNLTANFDPAFERRFLYKICFHKPDVVSQTKIWQSMIAQLDEDAARTLAARYDFSGGQIENVARKHVVDCILYNKSVSLSQLDDYCRQELIDKTPLRTAIGFKHERK